MLLCNADKNSQGFSMIETTIILMIVGILSAIAVPNFLAMYNRVKLNDAVTKVRGALQEAQREAIRKNHLCTVTLDTTNPKNNKVIGSCFVTGARTLADDGVAMATNILPPTGAGLPAIPFSFKGTTTTMALSGGTNSGTIVLSLADGSGQKKCLVISKGIGIMRTGDYSGSTSSYITADNCTTPNEKQS